MCCGSWLGERLLEEFYGGSEECTCFEHIWHRPDSSVAAENASIDPEDMMEIAVQNPR